MLKIPKQTIINKITAQTNLSASDIEERIAQKLSELSGLISEEGAAHIIANELGVNIFEEKPGQLTTIQEIIPGMKNAHTAGKVLTIYPQTEFTKNGNQGKVQAILIADNTARIRIAFWNESVEHIAQLKENDIIEINGAYARNNQGRVELSANDQTTITINPPNITIDEVAQAQTIQAPLSYIKDLTEDTIKKQPQYVSVVGTCVQAYQPVFYAPKQIREEKQIITDEDKTHAVGNIIIDDGTGTLRIALFNELLSDFMQTPYEQLKQQDVWTKTKDTTLGAMIQITGRAVYNDQFERIEIIANDAKIITVQQAQQLIQQLPELN